MESYDLRSEIAAKGHKYYVQTNLVYSQQAIVTSLFHEGSLLSKQVDKYDATLSLDQARIRVREFHEEKKSRIQSLLEIRDKLKRTEDGKAHLKLGEALYYQSLFRESMAEVVKAVKLGEEKAKAFSVLGNCLVALRDYEKAIKSFRKGLEISPGYPDLYNDLGRAYLSLKQCREAVRSFEKAVELNKYYHEAFLNLATALCLNVVEKQDYELSRGLGEKLNTILAKTLQLKPSLDTQEFREALDAAENREYPAAYKRLSKIQEESSKVVANHLSLDLYLILKFNSENISEAEIDRYIERTRRALDANPEYADLQNDLGVLYTAKCKLYIDKAKNSFQSSLKINKKFKKAEKNLKLTENDGQGIHLLLRALLD
ncbi:MAG: tetratricopeptide repeat protein [Candidatus Krumholzibacteria bacterium]|nr:tetratricopeptide repeat protein [Candidatus Krumholzibacteria bacterium]